MVDHAAIAARHGYHHLRVARVVEETADSRSFVLDVPPDLREAFRYEAGQFCTFRIHTGEPGEDEHARCYSMSSAPDVDADLTVTVKRVPGGIVSNWLIDHVAEGDELEVTRPAGTFRPHGDDTPIIGFCGGSGVTPVISIAKHALASTDRSVRLLYANRDQDSVIFDAALDELRDLHPDRLAVRHHFDDASGFLDAASIREFVRDDIDAAFCICGPGPFMDLVEATLLELGVDQRQIAIERFVTTPTTPASEAASDPADQPAEGDAAAIESIVVILKGKKHELTYRAGDTVLETARRNSVSTPYSCEAGSCATCMGLLREGAVHMKHNEALEDDEVEEGWVLTCQSVPTEGPVVIEYEPL